MTAKATQMPGMMAYYRYAFDFGDREEHAATIASLFLLAPRTFECKNFN